MKTINYIMTLVGLSVALPESSRAQTCYTAQIIPPVAGADWSEPRDINSAGQVTGATISSSQEVGGFVYSNGAIQPIANPQSWTALGGRAINDSAHLAFTANSSIGVDGFLSSNGTQDIGTLSVAGQNIVYEETIPYAINPSDHIVGFSFTDYAYGYGNTQPRAFLWQPWIGMQNLGVLANGGPNYESKALGVNDLDQVVGFSGTTFWHHAFLWTPAGGMVDLGALGGALSNALSSFAYAINGSGQIVGTSLIPGYPLMTHAVAWIGGSILDVGNAAPAYNTTATSINNRGQIAGVGSPTDFNPDGDFAFLYDLSTNQMQNLSASLSPPNPDLVIEGLPKINNAGQIAANGHFISTQQKMGLLLTPCPPAPPSLTGNYSGTLTGVLNGHWNTGTMTFVLAEQRNVVSGTWTAGSGASGAVNGEVFGSAFYFTLAMNKPCMGYFWGSASILENFAHLSGNYVGAACPGSIPGFGTFDVRRR